MPRTCTKSTCDAQASRPRSCADCAKPKQARPSIPVDFKRAALLSVQHDPDLAHQLTDREFRLVYAMAKRVRDARRPKGCQR